MVTSVLIAAEAWHPKLRQDRTSLRQLQQAERSFESTARYWLTSYLKLALQHLESYGTPLVPGAGAVGRASTRWLDEVDRFFDFQGFRRAVIAAYVPPLALGAMAGSKDVPRSARRATERQLRRFADPIQVPLNVKSDIAETIKQKYPDYSIADQNELYSKAIQDYQKAQAVYDEVAKANLDKLVNLTPSDSVKVLKTVGGFNVADELELVVMNQIPGVPLGAPLETEIMAHVQQLYEGGMLSTAQKEQLAQQMLNKLEAGMGAGAGGGLPPGPPPALSYMNAPESIVADVSWTLHNPEVANWALSHSAELVTNVTQTIKDKIRAMVLTSDALGESRDQLAERIRGAVGEIPPWRAKLIAQTEIIMAHSQGTLATYSKYGDVVKGKRWVDGQSRACALCIALNGKVVPLGEDFEVGVSAPPRHPGCRCAVAASLTPGKRPKAQQQPLVSRTTKGRLPSTRVPKMSEIKDWDENPVWSKVMGVKRPRVEPSDFPSSEYKDQTVRALGAHLRRAAEKDVVVRGQVSKFNKLARLDGVRGRAGYDDYDKLANSMVSQWAGTSADNNPLALAIQRSAAKEFGLPLPPHIVAEHLKDMKHFGLGQMTAEQIEKEFGDAFRVVLRAQYDITQAALAKAGIKEVVLYRGQGLPYKGLIGDTEVLYANSISLQPMSSFSVSMETAKAFSHGYDIASTVTAAIVPAERIMSTAATGYGCITEGELVVLGGENLPGVVAIAKRDYLLPTTIARWVQALADAGLAP